MKQIDLNLSKKDYMDIELHLWDIYYNIESDLKLSQLSKNRKMSKVLKLIKKLIHNYTSIHVKYKELESK